MYFDLFILFFVMKREGKPKRIITKNEEEKKEDEMKC